MTNMLNNKLLFFSIHLGISIDINLKSVLIWKFVLNKVKKMLWSCNTKLDSYGWTLCIVL